MLAGAGRGPPGYLRHDLGLACGTVTCGVAAVPSSERRQCVCVSACAHWILSRLTTRTPSTPRSTMPWPLLYILLLAVKEVFPQKPTFTKLSDIYWNATNPM